MNNLKSNEKILIRYKRFSWKQFFAIITIFLLLSLTQTQIMDTFINKGTFQQAKYYFTAMTLLWTIVAITFILIQHHWVKKNFGKPLEELCEVTQEVAQGNFDVHLDSKNQSEYIAVTYENFNQMVQRLSSIETLKDSFIADVSHEFRTPLSVIQNYGTALQSENLSEKDRFEYADTIIEATRRLTSFITNILRLNKLENQEVATDISSFDLSNQLTEAVLSFSTKLDSKSIQLETDIMDTCPIESNEELLFIVWQNLISNAIKFTPDNGKIFIQQKIKNNKIIVTINDSGPGMEDETIQRIFDKFYQADISHFTEGNGLGLSLTARILSLLNGEVCVDSEIGKGSSFSITLSKKYSI